MDGANINFWKEAMGKLVVQKVSFPLTYESKANNVRWVDLSVTEDFMVVAKNPRLYWVLMVKMKSPKMAMKSVSG